MKKITFIIAIALCLLALFACEIQTKDEHVHAYGEWETVTEASCTSDGSTERSCACGKKERKTIGKMGHTEEIIPAVEPTCTESGLTEGKKCSVCGKVTVKRKFIAKLDHTEEVVPAVEPTCTESGLTEGKKCSVCDEIIKEQKTIDALGHSYIYTEEADESGNITTFKVCQRENCDYVKENPSGMYDNSGRMIASWDELVNDYGLDVEKNYYSSISYYPQQIGYILTTYNRFGNASKLVIDDSVTVIGSNAFRSCPLLTEIVLPDSVTTISEYAFIYCSKLKSIKLSSNLRSIDICAFYECRSLENISIPEGVTTIGLNAFLLCVKLKDVTLPSTLTSIGSNAFSHCEALEEIIIPSGVKSIGTRAFFRCYKLQSITLPIGLTTIESEAFYFCESLKEIEIPNTVTHIYGSAFAVCYSLEKVIIPESVVYIETFAFEECTSLKEIYIPKNVEKIWYLVFDNCPSLARIIVDEDNKFYKTVDGHLYDIDGKTLVRYVDAQKDESYKVLDGTTLIYGGAFDSCKSIKSIFIPKSVTEIGFFALGGCESLTDVYYEGTAEDWAKVVIDNYQNGNKELLEATIHFNCSSDEL